MDPAVAHGESLGRRMLGGAGVLSLTPYRADATATIPVMSHQLSDGGRLLVVCPAADAAFFGDTEVRVDGVKKAPELAADITVAGLHGLGEVRWLTIGDGAEVGAAAATAADTDTGSGPDAASSVADLSLEGNSAGLYAMGIVQLEKALVHGPYGVVKLRMDELRPLREESALASREVDARDIVGRLSQQRLGQLLSDVLVGFAPGFRCSEFEMEPSAALHARDAVGGDVWIADIDTTGLILSTMYGSRLTSVFVAFPEPVREFSDLARAVSALADLTSARHASPRI
ncbi:hypothetical protein [uncultured Corynebacterium sp.]|uniref:hypothetical protein n=1 Tax=uncultured Corynebacterium sp. TaxID=159447 RepID=UPI0025F93B72|nr:hypothetical protein [uncultured Corynebacterium sp.]